METAVEGKECRGETHGKSDEGHIAAALHYVTVRYVSPVSMDSLLFLHGLPHSA